MLLRFSYLWLLFFLINPVVSFKALSQVAIPLSCEERIGDFAKSVNKILGATFTNLQQLCTGAETDYCKKFFENVQNMTTEVVRIGLIDEPGNQQFLCQSFMGWQNPRNLPANTSNRKISCVSCSSMIQSAFKITQKVLGTVPAMLYHCNQSDCLDLKSNVTMLSQIAGGISFNGEITDSVCRVGFSCK